MSERELLIRVDERLNHVRKSIPVMSKAINRHDRELLVAKVLFVLVIIAIAIKYPVVAEALARVLG